LNNKAENACVFVLVWTELVFSFEGLSFVKCFKKKGTAVFLTAFLKFVHIKAKYAVLEKLI